MAKKSRGFMVVAILRADGSRTDFGIHQEMSLEEVQRKVGGYVEPVATTLRGHRLLVNEEGLMRGLPPNAQATALVAPGVWVHHGIVGDALLVRS